jgi:hypothetical protein
MTDITENITADVEWKVTPIKQRIKQRTSGLNRRMTEPLTGQLRLSYILWCGFMPVTETTRLA